MKNLTQILCCIILILGFSTPSKAQGWEIFVPGPLPDNSTIQYALFSGANNGVRIAYYDIDGFFKMLNYDVNGDFIGNEGVPVTNNWYFIQSDNSGATYWWIDNKIRKIDANNQIIWTFNMSNTAGALVSPGPNGSTYAQYSDNNSNVVIDAINKDGILEHRFNINPDELFFFLPTSDFGLLYVNFTYRWEATWTKLDHQGNVVWKKPSGNFDNIRMGSTDGSTYLINLNYELVKLDATGNIVWIKSITSSNLILSTYDQTVIELSDGNIAILSYGYDLTTNNDVLQITKINAQTGALIWEKKSSNSLDWILCNLGFFEMADGGLLATAKINSSTTGEPLIFIMRTDQNGNTLTDKIDEKIHQGENADCQWQIAENADKTAFLNGRPEFSKIMPNEELEYLIRFQNTGNDTAFNIVVVDTLTTYLDASSVLPGVSSHPYSFELDKGHILRFSFRNILLPDSNTNEVASHGFVKFRVRQNPNNVIGNEIKNSAAIFFDYNAPIITNETNLKISIPSRTADLENRVYAQIFPIPAREKVQVSLKNADAGTVLWRMFDATGKLISNGQSSRTTVFDIPRNGQPSGVYYCQFLMENGQTVFGKVIFD
jgi:uncharacterized repeat protein (TIGR01451 family)